MPPTDQYAVTFERGTQIKFGDRTHYHISGTASIDTEGNVAHVGDVTAQAEHMLDNVEALLNNYGSGLSDLKSAVIYLRDSTDYTAVREVIEVRMSRDLPRIYLQASVCRQDWLLEMDGIAVREEGDRQFDEFI